MTTQDQQARVYRAMWTGRAIDEHDLDVAMRVARMRGSGAPRRRSVVSAIATAFWATILVLDIWFRHGGLRWLGAAGAGAFLSLGLVLFYLRARMRRRLRQMA
jgi:hypothetical protein